jgi:hypothetical protein
MKKLLTILFLFPLILFAQKRTTGTGTGLQVYATNPVFTTPNIGSATGSITGSAGSATGNAGTATALQTARNINGTPFNGTADITVTAAAGTLTGGTLASGVTASSLVSFGSTPTIVTPSFTTGFTIGGTAVTGTFIRGNATNFVASTLTIPNTATQGDMFVATGPNAMGVVAVQATANKILMAGASTVPTWSTPTYPNATATSRAIIVGDGTNYVKSTETWAVPGTSGNILQSDGTNWTSTTNKGGWTELHVAGSDFTTTSTSLVDVTGLISGTLATATLYEFEAVLYVNSTSTAGMAVGVQQSGTGSGQIGTFAGTATSGAATGAAIASNALNTASAPCVLVNGDGSITINGHIKTGSSGTPTISCKVLKTTSGTAKVYIGSVLRFRLAQ